MILPIFEPSGLLELESNQKEGVQLKHIEPGDAMSPRKYDEINKMPKWERRRYEIMVYRKGIKGEVFRMEMYDKSCYIVGRSLGKNESSEEKEVVVADIPIEEESCSKEHCAIQFRLKDKVLVPYLIDLESSNGTSLNDSTLPSARYIEIRSGDVIHVSEDPEDTDFELVFLVV